MKSQVADKYLDVYFTDPVQLVSFPFPPFWTSGGVAFPVFIVKKTGKHFLRLALPESLKVDKEGNLELKYDDWTEIRVGASKLRKIKIVYP